jgi:hypothetical protein
VVSPMRRSPNGSQDLYRACHQAPTRRNGTGRDQGRLSIGFYLSLRSIRCSYRFQGVAVTVPLGTSPAPSLFRWAKCLAVLVVTGTLGAVLGGALVTLVQNFASSPVGSSSVNYPVLLFRYVAAMGLFVFGSASGRWRVSLCRRVIPVIGSVPAAFGRVVLE